MTNEVVRTAHAHWNGDMARGEGNIDTPNKSLDNAYSLDSRLGGAAGTNPEELLAASHASCFAMVLANVASTQGFDVRGVDTNVKTHLDLADTKHRIKNIEIEVVADIPGMDNENLNEALEQTQRSCVISQALQAVPMSVRGKVKANKSK